MVLEVFKVLEDLGRGSIDGNLGRYLDLYITPLVLGFQYYLQVIIFGEGMVVFVY